MASSPQPFAEAAVDYARRGWRVFVIPPGQKVPRVRWGAGDERVRATADPEEVARRAAVYADHNIGIATGQGLAVLDVDPQHGGVVPSWAPPTLCARTPSGGVHLYYRVEREVRSSQGALGPGIDVRGEGGMVVAPPSIIWPKTYEDGARSYEWANAHLWNEELDNGGTLARIDAALLNPPVKPSHTAQLTGTFGEGQRHSAMLSLAGKMRSHGCEEPEIQAALRALNDTRFKPPLEYKWVDRIARDIVARYEPNDDLLP